MLRKYNVHLQGRYITTLQTRCNNKKKPIRMERTLPTVQYKLIFIVTRNYVYLLLDVNNDNKTM